MAYQGEVGRWNWGPELEGGNEVEKWVREGRELSALTFLSHLPPLSLSFKKLNFRQENEFVRRTNDYDNGDKAYAILMR